MRLGTSRRNTMGFFLLVASACTRAHPRPVGAFAASFASLLNKQTNTRRQQSSTTTTSAITKSFLRPAFVSFSSKGSSDTDSSKEYDFDYFVIGAGSGGIASARRAATYGAKVAVAEFQRLGGTCVNVGCVPKKVMWNAASIAETVHDMKHYGFDGVEHITFDWNVLKQARDKYIQRLNGIYERNLESSGVAQINGYASFAGGEDPHTVTVSSPEGETFTYTAKHILIAVGGVPVFPSGEGVMEHSITSDGFFELEDIPRKAVVVGAGYIAVELAGVLQALGTDTNLVLRKDQALRTFDSMVRDTLDEEMVRQGIQIHRNTDGVEKIEANGEMKTVYLKNGDKIEDVDCVLVAPGRRPNVDKLNLSAVGVKQTGKGYIVADEYSETDTKGIYALVGDIRWLSCCSHVTNGMDISLTQSPYSYHFPFLNRVTCAARSN